MEMVVHLCDPLQPARTVLSRPERSFQKFLSIPTVGKFFKNIFKMSKWFEYQYCSNYHIESIINSVNNLSLTQSQYSIIIKWGSRSLQTPNSLTMKGWSSLEYISISCLNSKNRCSSFISRDLTTTKVSGSTSRMSRALARNMSPNTPLPTNTSKACDENVLVKSTPHADKFVCKN